MLDINISDLGVCTLKYKNENKINTTKRCSIDSMLELFNTNKKMNTPILPFGTRKYEISENGTHYIVLEIPPAIRHAKYVRGDDVLFEGDIPFPPTVMVHSIRSNGGKFIVNQTKIFALKQPLGGLDDKLYHYPTPNIFSDHKICWGGASEYLRFNELSELGRTVDLFFSAMYNTDIHPRINLYEDVRNYWKDIQKTGVFNYEVLSDARTTLKEVLNSNF